MEGEKIVKGIDVEKGLREGWLHKLEPEKAIGFLYYGNKKFKDACEALIRANLVNVYWDDTTNDLVLEKND